MQSATYRPLQEFVTELPEKYREILGIYDRAYAYGVIGFYPLQQIQLCIRVAKFLIAAVDSSFSGLFINTSTSLEENDFNLILANSKASKDLPAKLLSQMSQISQMNVSSPPKSTAKIFAIPEKVKNTISKLEIIVWIHRAANSGHEFLSLQDQILLITELIALCSQIGSKRKQAYYLMVLAEILMKAQAHPDSIFGSTSTSNYAAQAALRCIGTQSKLLDSDWNTKLYSAKLENSKVWVEMYGADPDLLIDSTEKFWLSFGWKELQLLVHDRAINLATGISDSHGVVSNTISLISKLYNYLSEEQIASYSQMLQNAILSRQNDFKSTKLGSRREPISLNLPVVRKIEIIGPSKQHFITEHKTKALASKSTFLYSPFEKVQPLDAGFIVINSNSFR